MLLEKKENTIVPPTILALFEQFPDLAFEEVFKGRFRLSLVDGDPQIWVEYWKIDNVQNGNDAWRYEVSHATAKTEYVGPYSHPTEKGCWIMALRFFSDNGFLPTPRDNSHLTPDTAKIAKQAQGARDFRASTNRGTPETGDFIADRNGVFRRVCAVYSDNCQQTTALEHRYYVGSTGHASYSGSLYASVPFERLAKAEELRPALFWTFKDGQSGAGRGVDLWLNVTVWQFDGAFLDNPWKVE